MLEQLELWLFNPTGLTPHGFCLLWEPGLLWLHAMSDIGIGLAYFGIPVVIVAVIRKRPDIGFRPIFFLFAAFILLCGAGHWLDLITLWVPAYGIEGIVKALTAMTSIATFFAMFKLYSEALSWPTPAQLNSAKADLLTVRQAEMRMAATAADALNAHAALAGELARRQAVEKELAENEERYRLLLEGVSNEALFLLDPDGNIETWNPGAQRIEGFTPAEIIGSNVSILFTPEDIASQTPERLMRIASEQGQVTEEGWRVRKDGSRFLARTSLRAIRRTDGRLRGFAKMTYDITDQRVEEEQRAIIIEAAPNGMMIVDETGTITLANAQVEQLFGYPRGALAGRSVELLLPGGLRVQHGAIEDTFAGGETVRGMAPPGQFVGRRQDGGEVPLEILLSPVKTQRGRIVVASLFDVSERLRIAAEQQEAHLREREEADATNARLDQLARHLADARDRAEQANRAKSRFLAGMSHELRTPLNGILGYAQILDIEGGLNPAQSARVGAMLEAGRHLLEMITSVLDFSVIEAEHVTLRPTEVDLQTIATACLELVRPAAEKKGLELHLSKSPGTPTTLVTDAMRLRQVMLNLLGNAVKFTTQGSVTLRMGMLPDDSVFRIEVADTGPGVPSDQRQRLFREFERIGEEASLEIEGAGLGLALSSGLANAMGGRLGYDENPGGGSIFWLEVPFSAPSSERADSAHPGLVLANQPLTQGRSLHALVVDDVLMNRDIARAFLESRGHLVTCVEGGAEAVSAAASTDFDVILMDVRMPGMDGMEATRQIRALPGRRGQIPVVALTAQAFTDQMEDCRQAGMDSHLAKPYDQESLLAAVYQAMNARRDNGAVIQPECSLATTSEFSRPVLGSDLQVLDRDVFESTAGLLPDTSVTSYLETLASLGRKLVADLRSPDALEKNGLALAEAAHRLAGSAGMFGFERLSILGRRFERALQAKTDDAAAIMEGLIAATEATCREIEVCNRSRADAAAIHAREPQ